MSYGLRIGPRVTSLRVPIARATRVFGIPDIRPGWRVTDANDDGAGTIVEAGTRFMAVRRGLFRVVYVPYRIVGAVRDGVVRLTVHKSELADPAWHVPPRSVL